MRPIVSQLAAAHGSALGSNPSSYNLPSACPGVSSSLRAAERRSTDAFPVGEGVAQWQQQVESHLVR